MPPDADISLIRRAFRRKAKSCHPDLFQQVSEEERKRQQKIFVRLSQAYEVLADPEKRNILDRQLGKSGAKASQPNNRKIEQAQVLLQVEEVTNKNQSFMAILMNLLLWNRMTL